MKSSAVAEAPLDRRSDDAQWLGEVSAVVLHQLVARGDVTVLAMLRTGEPAPAPVIALCKDGPVERRRCVAVGRHAVRDVLAAGLDGSSATEAPAARIRASGSCRPPPCDSAT